MTTKEALENAARVESIGHIAFRGEWEYFHGPDGDVYRASVHCPMSVYGYRQGARFEATASSWQHMEAREARKGE